MFSFVARPPAYEKIDQEVSSPRNEHSEINDQCDCDREESRLKRKSWLSRHRVALLVHSLFVVGNLAIIYFASLTRKWDPAHAYTPANHVIEYEHRGFEDVPIRLHDGSLNPNKPTDFGGDPRPALDAAWRNLTKNQNIRLSRDDLGHDLEDDSVIQLSDGSGVFATLAVFHGLHCIERLHHYLYFDHYYSEFSQEDQVVLKYHTEHCLDWLRQYLTCNADTTPIMMHWIAESPLPIAKVDGSKHSCVKWDPIDEWVGERTFVPSNDNIKHPIYGNPYDNEINRATGLQRTKGHHYVLSNGSILP